MEVELLCRSPQYLPYLSRQSYDAWYVAIAEALKLPLATLDEPLSKSNGVTCEFLTPGF